MTHLYSSKTPALWCCALVFRLAAHTHGFNARMARMLIPLRSALPRGPSQPEQDSYLHHNPCAKDRHVMFDTTSR